MHSKPSLLARNFAGPAAFAVALVLLHAVTPTEARSQEATVEGAVRVGNEPATDAEITVPGLGRRVEVDPSGRFRLTLPRGGDYVVQAISPRWGRAVESVRVAPGDTVQLELQLESLFHLDELVVTARVGSVRSSEAYQPGSVVTARELVAAGEATLGETLAGEPGVGSTYFGPGASRPVIRGIGGDRVRVLENGTGTGDASSVSPDHAVSLEARTAESIEVVRGPATLLYGSSAVGGVVNVLDGRIARERPTEPISGHLEGLVGTVAGERTGSARLAGSGGGFVVTGTGLLRDASHYDVPVGGDVVELENSALESGQGSLGLGYVGDRGYFGVGWSGTDSRYGVPHPEHGEEEEEEELVTIDLDRRRFELDGEIRFAAGPIRNVRAKASTTDYRHVELEGSVPGTTFDNDFHEIRIESSHELGDRTSGALGTQLSERNFSAVGEEAFTPATETRTFAVFGYEEVALADALRVEGGLRFERQRSDGAAVQERSFRALSSSLSLNWDAAEILTLAVSGSRSVKIPSPEELFSEGPHAATQAYELGDPDLGKETALSLDVTAHLHAPRFRGTASVFATDFDEFIYEEETGGSIDGLPVFAYVQGDARFSGFELEGEWDVIEGEASRGETHLAVEAMADFVTATLTSRDEPLPRIPPLRFGGGFTLRRGPVLFDLGARRTTRQTRTAAAESATEGFTLLEGSVSYRLFTGSVFHDLTLVGTNLTNEEARLHTSFLKDVAPLPARDVRLVYRVNF